MKKPGSRERTHVMKFSDARSAAVGGPIPAASAAFRMPRIRMTSLSAKMHRRIDAVRDEMSPSTADRRTTGLPSWTSAGLVMQAAIPFIQTAEPLPELVHQRTKSGLGQSRV